MLHRMIFPVLSRPWSMNSVSVSQSVSISRGVVNVVRWLYQHIQAFYSGVEGGSLLFDMLGGVETRCSLSSVCFVLGIITTVDLFVFLSHGPQPSVT